MDQAAYRRGARELALARRRMRGLMIAVAVFGFVVNMLMLTGPLYMLNVYDRVLGSRSVETLVTLTLIVGFLFAILALLDSARGQVMARAGLRLRGALEARVFDAGLAGRSQPGAAGRAASAQHDLEAVHRLLLSPAFLALHDLPFAPLFLAGIFLFHPLLGALALVAALVLVMFALANQFLLQAPLRDAANATGRAEAMAALMQDEAEVIRALDMRAGAFARWQGVRQQALAAGIVAADTGSRFGAAIRALRLFVQSAMLGLGAFLVIRGELSAGAMIAASILLGRALAPLEVIVGQWTLFARAREGWINLAVLLGTCPPMRERMVLPPPQARLEVEHLAIMSPGATTGQAPLLRGVGFAAGPGQVVGVIGPSGAGKSVLARAVVGTLSPLHGEVRLGGARLGQLSEPGRHIGYLPQRIGFFDGTLRENIARLAPEPDDAAVIRAARLAGAHEMILRLPDGYETRLHAGGGLSGGQMQRVALARALYGDPALVVLDEPDANLDSDGLRALSMTLRALREADKCTLLVTHRPALIQECDLVLALDGGTMRAFGPRDAVLREVLANVHDFPAAQTATP